MEFETEDLFCVGLPTMYREYFLIGQQQIATKNIVKQRCLLVANPFSNNIIGYLNLIWFERPKLMKMINEVQKHREKGFLKKGALNIFLKSIKEFKI